MSKILKKILSFIMVLSLILTNTPSIPVFASQNTLSESEIIVTEDGLYVGDTFYTIEQFEIMLNNAVVDNNNQSNPIQTRSALLAGSYFIPGIGQVLITATGVVIVGGAVIAAGSWLYNSITSWFSSHAFNSKFKRSAEDSVNNADSNKRHHIMQSKHNWNKFNKDPKWSNVAPILIEVLKNGKEQWERGDVYTRTLIYKGETVVVRFIKDAEGLIRAISTAWTK